ncbi:hypothetical protein I541_5596 [Mycobacteroides abscessus]|nr:hypothetical protein I541_5596 [Mycobacteroides abscessus]
MGAIADGTSEGTVVARSRRTVTLSASRGYSREPRVHDLI